MTVEQQEHKKHTPNSAELAETEYAHWKQLVGLPFAFPYLDPLGEDGANDMGFLELGHIHSLATERIKDAIPSKLPVVVLIVKGQGCTTLSRYIFANTKKEVVIGNRRGNSIVVSTHLELDDIEPRSIDEKIRRDLLYDFVVNQKMGSPDIFRFPEAHIPLLAILGNYWDKTNVVGPEGRSIANLAKLTFFGQSIDDLLKHDFFKARRISLQVDLSSQSAYNKDPDDYKVEVQSLQKKVRRLVELAPDKFAEMYFVSRDGFQILQSKWNREYQVIEYPELFSADIFAMVSRRYRPREGSLAAVVDPSLLIALGQPINQVIQEFDRKLLEKFGKSEDIPYRISK